MFNLATKLLFALTGAVLVLAVGYDVAVGERSGFVILLFLALAAFVLACATVGSAVPDIAPVVPADAPPPELRATTTGPPARGSGWSLAAAAAVTVLAAGAAVGPAVVVAGVVAVLVATGGWFARAWSEHPSWTGRVRERVSTRLVMPVGLPLVTFLLVLTIAVSVSRILLAVPERASVVVALAVALAVLLGCAWVASRPLLGSSVVIALAVLAAVSVLGAGIAGALSGERRFEPEEGEDNVFRVTAKDIKFSRARLTVPTGREVVLEFENRDRDVYHNMAVYRGEGPSATPVFNGEGFPGDGERDYQLRTPAPGTYVFLCDFHPANMKGSFVVTPR